MKKTIYIVGVVVLIIGGFLILKTNNKDDFSNKNYEIIDNEVNCSSTKEQFYEDNNYVYTFNCPKSDKIKIIFDEGATYNLKYALKHKILTIDSLEEHGLVFNKEKK